MMAAVARSEPRTPCSIVGGGRIRDWNSGGMEDPDGLLANIAQNIEKLRGNRSSPQEKEFVLKQLFELAGAKREARAAIGSHSQAVPLLVALLRSGTPAAKIDAAATLGALCKEEELRVKVLLGGCIPLLLALLQSGFPNAQVSAAQALHAVSRGGAVDHVGAKIFATEGVVPSLWEQLQPRHKLERSVDGLLTGALRNLCTNTEGFWPATLEAGGVDILVRLLSDGSSEAKANASALLANLLLASDSSGMVALRAGVIEHLLGLIAPGSDISVRAEAAGTLRALSATSEDARNFLVNAGAISILIGATVAPSKEFMQGKFAQALQENAMNALANISGGMAHVVLSLAESIEPCRSDLQTADTIGALAYALMVSDETSSNIQPKQIEEMLVRQLVGRSSQLVHERAIEALASLYGNSRLLQQGLAHAEGKKMLVGLITMAAADVQEELTRSLRSLCNNSEATDLWRALRGREGVQMLISLLGLSSEQQQEYAVALLSILSEEVDESKWAITAAGGIPPLVQLLETGSAKAREDAALVLSNLCLHSEDIRACVETAEAVPALLWLLKNAGTKGQEIAARALKELVRNSDASTISQLTALLTGDLPESKVFVLDVLGSLLCIAPGSDILKEGTAVNESFAAIIGLLNSSDEETQGHSASVLAKVFEARKDLRESRVITIALEPLVELLAAENEQIAMESARALAASFLSIKKNPQIALTGRVSALPLIELAGSPNVAAAEVAATAFANLLLHPEMAGAAPVEDIISPLTRVLREGTIKGKGHAACALARLLRVRPVDNDLVDGIHHSGTVLALVSLLAETDLSDEVTLEALEALACLAKVKRGGASRRPPWAVLADAPYSLSPLVTCLAAGLPAIQEKAVEVLSKLCRDQPVVLGDSIAGTPRCVAALADRVIDSRSLEVRVGAASLLICASKEHKERSMVALHESGAFLELIRSLVAMLNFKLYQNSIESGGYDAVERGKDMKRRERVIERVFSQVTDGDQLLDHDPAAMLGVTVALWLLSIIASFDSKSKATIMEAGAIEVLTDKLAGHVMTATQVDTEESASVWVSALLLAILFQDRDVTRSPTTIRSIPFLSALLKSEEAINCYFAAQALASLVCNGSRGTLLTVANSGAAGGLIPLLGSVETDMSNLVALAEEFSLFANPDQVALERLFRVDDIRVGATARKVIPALVDLLKPNAERPGSTPLSLALLTQLAEGSDANKIAMAEAGALDALTKYLSLGPADAIEEATVDLMSLLFSSPDLCRYDSSIGAVSQLVAVLRLGTRKARYNAARALQGLFAAEHIKVGETAKQSIPPLVEMLLSGGSEKEQRAAIGALVRLSSDNPPKALAIADGEANAVEGLCRVLSMECSSAELKEDAAELCRVLFGNSRVRASPATSNCIPPLVALLYADSIAARRAGARALDNLLDDEQQAELVAAQGTVVPLVSLVSGSDNHYSLHEAAVSALTKLGKDRPLSKLDMVKAGIIDHALEILATAPDPLCTSIAELLRILTNNSSIANGQEVGYVVEPLFAILTRPDLSAVGQHSSMQVLVNILEKPQHMANLKLSPMQAVEPLVPLLDSPSQAVQTLAAELLSHLLIQEQFQRDMLSQQVIVPLVRVLGMAVPSLQQKAIKALESVSNSWPSAVADVGGIVELSRVIVQTNPPPSHALWESASLVLSNILRFSSQYYLHVPLAVLVRMLRSSSESVVVEALSALLVLEREDASSAEAMAEAGAVEALLELLRCHQCEEAATRLLEALFNNVKVRETKGAKYAISPLSQYLLDPQTRTHSSRLLAALALGDLFQNDTLSRSADAVSACRALVSMLEDQPTEEMKMIAVCALQNLVMHSKSNRRAVAEAGGVQVVLELLNASNPETAGQVATLIKLLFSSHTIQEYASSEIVRSLTAALEREFWATGTVNEDILKAVAVLLGNFPRLRSAEAATLCIPQLVGALKAGTEPAQEAALDALCLLKQLWSASPVEVAKAQAMASAEAVPLLQLVMRSGPQRFQDRADNLLQSLPGSLLVTIVRGHNLKQSVTGTNAFCKLTLGNGPPQQTKVVQHNSSPEWKQGFAWAFDTPPKGQKLHISCKSKNAFGKGSLGKVTIQIDRVVMLGTINGQYTLTPEKNRDGTSRSLEIEFQWSNR